MDYEHQPTPGIGVWLGSGLLTLIGGLSLLYVQLTADEDSWGLAVFGGALVLVGLVVFGNGARQFVRRRR